MGTFVSGYNGENYPSSTAPNDNVLVNFFFVKIAMVITDTLDEREIEKVTAFENHKKSLIQHCERFEANNVIRQVNF